MTLNGNFSSLNFSNFNKMSQKIRIKLKSYDHKLVDKSAEKIVKAVKAVSPATKTRHFETKEELITVLKGEVKEGDTILVKASHFMNFPEIVKAL